MTETTAPDRARRRALIAVGFCIAAIVAIVALAITLSENVVYFRTVTEAVDQRKNDGTSQVRVAGKVVETSENARTVRFRITDGTTTMTVVHRGDVPELFELKRPVVVEGHWGDQQVFRSERILIRHGNDYEPPKVDDGPTEVDGS